MKIDDTFLLQQKLSLVLRYSWRTKTHQRAFWKTVFGGVLWHRTFETLCPPTHDVLLQKTLNSRPNQGQETWTEHVRLNKLPQFNLKLIRWRLLWLNYSMKWSSGKAIEWSHNADREEVLVCFVAKKDDCCTTSLICQIRAKKKTKKTK